MPPEEPSVSWTMDVETCRFLDVNQGAVELSGYTRSELLNMTIFDFVVPEEHERLRQHMRERGESGLSGEWTCRRKDGIRFTIETRFNNFESYGNKVSFVFARHIR